MAPSQLVLDSAALMSESIMIGVYAVLTISVLWLLVRRRRTMPISQKILFIVSILMFCISVAHLALVFVSITTKPTIWNGQTRVILSIFQFVFGDLILIWRLWVVWGGNYWVALGPFCIMAVAAGFQLKIASNVYLLAHASYFGVATSALLVVNTSICTLLIAGKIWYTRYRLKSIANLKTPGFGGTILLFIESGALYAAVQICSLILNHVKNNGLHILLDIELPLIGILPTLIVVVVHFELTAPSSTAPSGELGSLRFGQRDQIYLNTISTATVREDEFTKHGGTQSQSMNSGDKVYHINQRSTRHSEV